MIHAAPDKIIVELIDPDESKDLGIILSAGEDTSYTQGTHIFFDSFVEHFEHNGETYYVLREEEVLAILT